MQKRNRRELVILYGSYDPVRIMRAAKRESGRLSQIASTARLIAELQRGRELTRDDVATLLNVKPAAADRQIRAIELHFKVLRQKRRGRTYIRLGPDDVVVARKPQPIGTVIAACLGASLAKLFEGTTYEGAMLEVVRELVRDTRSSERFKDVRRQFVFLTRGGEKALPEAQGLLDDLVEAILSRHHLRLRYIGFEGKARTETVQPLSLAVYEHQLYLLAREDGGGVHPYRFARIQRARQLPGAFEYPDKDSYEPARVFADSFGVFVDPKYPLTRIELSLATRWDHYVKTHRWHPSQQSFRERDRVRVVITVRVCPEVLAWVLSFGPDARVVEPTWLREKIASQVNALGRVDRRTKHPTTKRRGTRRRA